MARRLTKPPSVRNDPWRSRKWNEVVRGRDFSPSDAPTIALLVSWYQVAEECMDEISHDSGVQVCYQNDAGDIKAVPQLATMKQASAEIRALSRQLGISDQAGPAAQGAGASVLRLVQEDRARKEEGRA